MKEEKYEDEEVEDEDEDKAEVNTFKIPFLLNVTIKTM